MPHIDIRSGPSYGTLDNMEQQRNDEGDRLLHGDNGYLSERNHDSDDSSVDEVQEGVRKIEAINMTWTSRTLVVAYIRFVQESPVDWNACTDVKTQVSFSWRFLRLWKAKLSCHCQRMRPVHLVNTR